MEIHWKSGVPDGLRAVAEPTCPYQYLLCARYLMILTYYVDECVLTDPSSSFFFSPDLEQYAIAAALITSGICSIINVSKMAIPFSDKIFGHTLYIGSGLLSVMGTSFTFLPVFEIAIRQMKLEGIDGEAAFGKMLGTSMVCCLLEVFFSVLPIRVIKKIFPPIVTAVTVILIGVALTGTGMKYWGGGVVCAEMVRASW